MGKEENKEVKETAEVTEDVKENTISQDEDVNDEELEAISGGYNPLSGIRDKNRVDR